jgi:nicotinamide-nucleotide amidase
MVETYRTDPLEYEKVFNNLVNGIIKYLTNSHIKAMVIGMSGGIDSTVVAALCKEVYNRTNGEFELIGVSMPCSTNKVDENDAATAAGTEFCTHFSVVSLESTFKAVEACCDLASNIASTPVSQGNIKARLRMITLYDIASKVGGIVMDTDNLTEHFLGFWTIHGDDGDFNPIGGLWKHEVYGLAKWMKENVYKDSKALEASIALMPTDGNGVKEGGDLAQIAPGKTYDNVDEILHSWVGLDPRIKLDVIKSGFQQGVFKQLCEKHGIDTVSMVIRRSINSGFKRKQRPFVIDIFNGNITEKNGKLF